MSDFLVNELAKKLQNDKYIPQLITMYIRGI